MVQWALGLIVGAVLAKGVAQSLKNRNVRVDFPLLIAGAYSGFIFAGLAYNGTIPLTSATAGSFIEQILGRIVELSETVFTVYNTTALILLLVLMPLLLVWIRPRHNPDEIADNVTENETDTQFDSTVTRPSEHLEKKRFLTTVLGVFLTIYLVTHFTKKWFFFESGHC